MKEATGELSMTVVVIVAVIALVALLGFLFGPSGVARDWLNSQWANMTQKTDAKADDIVG